MVRRERSSPGDYRGRSPGRPPGARPVRGRCEAGQRRGDESWPGYHPTVKLPHAAVALLVSLGLCAPRDGGAAVVDQRGEIVVIEGDSQTVSGGPGGYGLGAENIDALLASFYDVYPDEFDMVCVFTSFADANNGGAYFMTPPPVASGLIGFINMNQIGFWGTDFGAQSTLGQEFAHAWLSFESFIDPGTGSVSDEFLGRDAAHWSSLLDADGSVVDGVDWVDNGDGTYSVESVMSKLGSLDLYVMGYYSADEVPPFFLLRNARSGGDAVGPLGIWEGTVGTGTTATADRLDLTIEDVIAATGPLPPVDMRQKDFRMAFVLVTAPGETADAMVSQLADMEKIRADWNAIYTEWTYGRGTMCTDATAPCDIPKAQFAGGQVREGEGADGDGVVEPGEGAVAEIRWVNTGTSTASGAIASIDLTGVPGADEPAAQPLIELAVGAETTTPFPFTVPSDLGCGVEYVVTARSALGLRTWNGQLAFTPGVVEGVVESFATDGGWRGNLAGVDTVAEDLAGAWDYGPAEPSTHATLAMQPEGGRGGAQDSAWWTGRVNRFGTGSNDVDSGLTTLTSAPFAVGGLTEPTLRYHLWYQAWVMNTTPPTTTSGDDLVVEVSSDEGVTWSEIDRVSGSPRLWEQRDVALTGRIANDATTLLFRFTAMDEPPVQNLVEVGIDDVSLYSLSPACEPDGCGCVVAGRSGAGGAGGALGGGALLVGVLLTLRRRRPRVHR